LFFCPLFATPSAFPCQAPCRPTSPCLSSPPHARSLTLSFHYPLSPLWGREGPGVPD
jgi:hypothetical protein